MEHEDGGGMDILVVLYLFGFVVAIGATFASWKADPRGTEEFSEWQVWTVLLLLLLVSWPFWAGTMIHRRI